MATISGTLLLSDGSPLVCGMVVFYAIGSASIRAAGSVVLPTEVRVSTDTSGQFQVELAAGSYRMAAEGARKTVEISVPDGDDAWGLDEVAVDSPGAMAGVIRWGSNPSGALSGSGLETLEGAVFRASIGGEYACSAGGYKYLVWPASLGSPSEGTGILDVATGLPVSMAGSAEGFESAENGWAYRIDSVGGVSCRVYRTRQAIGGILKLQVNHG